MSTIHCHDSKTFKHDDSLANLNTSGRKMTVHGCLFTYENNIARYHRNKRTEFGDRGCCWNLCEKLYRIRYYCGVCNLCILLLTHEDVSLSSILIQKHIYLHRQFAHYFVAFSPYLIFLFYLA
jgi:hypothetical protein